MKKLLLLILLPSIFYCQNTSNVSVTIDTPNTLCNVGDCTVLNANYTDVKSTTDYTVSSINYNPIYPFLGGVDVGIADADDQWSSSIALPFIFSFYGNCYNSITIGNNGVASFESNLPTTVQACPWSFTQQIPSTSFPTKNAIYGVYQDADSRYTISPTSSINYMLVGSAPNRSFVINFYHLGQYQCNLSSGFQTSQIVLHESSNIIDVNVENRAACASWNAGRGVIGIQNQSGTLASFPLGRNTGNWSTTNESWRFTPNGVSISQFSWYRDGIFLTTDNPITVCPTSPNDTSVYSAHVNYQNCGLSSTISEEIVINLLPQPQLQEPIDLIYCNSIGSATADLTQNNPIILQNVNPNDFDISYFLTLADATNFSNPIFNTNIFQTFIGTQTIYTRVENLITGCYYIKPFNVIVSAPVSAPTGNVVQNFSTGQTLNDLVVSGQNINWYDAPNGGNSLPGTTLLENNSTYYASQTVNNCESRNVNSSRLPVTAQLVLSANEFSLSELSVYPNPAKNKITISYNKTLNLLEIYNSIGQKVKGKAVDTKTEVLEISDLQSGIYFVKVYSENKFTVVKFIKE